MLGYDISWAGFNVIEVMSSSKFTYKRIGYLSSSQSFHSDTEVSLLLVSVYTCIVTQENCNIISVIYMYTECLQLMKCACSCLGCA